MINKVIDLSHHNTLTSNAFHQLAADGMIGIIHKATQGKTMVDEKYADRERRARSVGMLWGAYHFLVAGVSVEDQLGHFLGQVDPRTTLLALDFETNGATGTTPTVDQAHEFVTRIAEETGRYPVFYSGHTIKEALGLRKDPLLGKCPLWWAQYGPTASIQASWDQYALWQYTGDGIGDTPHNAPGVLGNVDRNKFKGSDDELRTWWLQQLAHAQAGSPASDGHH